MHRRVGGAPVPVWGCNDMVVVVVVGVALVGLVARLGGLLLLL